MLIEEKSHWLTRVYIREGDLVVPDHILLDIWYYVCLDNDPKNQLVVDGPVSFSNGGYCCGDLRHEETSFELIALDQIKLNLSFRDLRKLNIDYLITRKDYSNEQFEDMQLILTGRTETLNIYHILYK